MITYGYGRIDLDDELDLAASLGASLLEILPLVERSARPGRARSASRESRILDP